MMKIRPLVLAALFMLMLPLSGAFAQEAEDISAECTFKSDSYARKWTNLTNKNYDAYWQSGERKNPYLVIQSEKPMYSLYLCFREMPESYVLQRKEGKEWVTFAEGDTRFHHAFYELDGETEIRVFSTQAKKHRLVLNEIFMFGQGEVPAWVQRWEDTEEKADIMLLVAHPDDELIFFAGTIPTYAVERDKRVVIAYLTYCDKTRRSEALNGLWSMGVKNYPVFGNFIDKYSRSLKEAYQKAGNNSTSTGKKKVHEWVTELFRKYQPDVVLTQDIKGEYGHGQHRMVADACIQCYDLAADPQQFPKSYEKYGAWEVKKLYVHLYGQEEQRVYFTWDTPLESQNGLTGMEAAEAAFKNHHLSQVELTFGIGERRVPLSVTEVGGYYDNTAFGLYASRVGEDVKKNDFLENITTDISEEIIFELVR